MIPNTKIDEITTSSNMKTAQASIDVTPEMFELLSSKIYSNKILAVVREISCNARDANVEANSEDAIKISLPSRLEPSFKVRDFGNGLTEDQVMSLYLKYGYSTKKHTNSQIGGFGIGSKSPLAYTDSFTVTSFKDGVQTSYSVYKDSGIPNVSKMFCIPTTQKNGLEVSVAVKPYDVYEFEEEALKFLKFFDHPVNLSEGVARRLNEAKDKLEQSVVLETNEFTLYDISNSTYVSDIPVFINMGGVMYKTSRKINSQFLTNGMMVVLKLNIGDVQVAASRESISEDESTVAIIDTAVDKILLTLKEKLQAKVDACKTLYEATKVVSKYSRGQRLFTYNGTLIEELVLELDPITVDVLARNYSGKIKQEKRKLNHLVNNSHTPKILVMDIIKYKQRFLKYYTTSLRNNGFVICDDISEVDDKYFEVYGKANIEIVKASDLYGTEVPEFTPVKTGKSQVKGVRLINKLGVESEVTELDEELEGKVVYLNRNTLIGDYLNYSAKGLADLLCEVATLGKLTFDVYFSNKTNASKCAKTKLEELTKQDLTDLLLSLYTDDQLKEEILFNEGSTLANAFTSSVAKIIEENLDDNLTELVSELLPSVSLKPRSNYIQYDIYSKLIVLNTVAADFKAKVDSHCINDSRLIDTNFDFLVDMRHVSSYCSNETKEIIFNYFKEKVEKLHNERGTN